MRDPGQHLKLLVVGSIRSKLPQKWVAAGWGGGIAPIGSLGRESCDRALQ